MSNETLKPLFCGECAHSHELPGYPSIWCEHLKRWTAREARDCGAGKPRPDSVDVSITPDGNRISVSLGGARSTEEWAREPGHFRTLRTSGDFEDDNLPEDLAFALLCLSSEVEHVMQCLYRHARRADTGAAQSGGQLPPAA